MSFGAKVFWAAALGEDKVFASGNGVVGTKTEALPLVAAIAPPMRMASLPAMPPRKSFLSFCIQPSLGVESC
jgi:hypothetical protein